MTLTNEEIIKLKTEIRQKVNFSSQYYGRLVKWYDFMANHYGIGLSDDYVFSPGEMFSVIKTEGRDIKISQSKTLPPAFVIQRLIYSLDCFKDWHYGLLGWNCEHYSRLVAKNKAVSYQIKDSIMGIFNHGGYHPTAVNDFNKYLNKIGSNDLIQK